MRRLLNRIVIPVVSQASASFATFALSIMAARALGLVDFGLFSLILTSQTFITGLIRSQTSELLLYKYSHDADADFSSRSREALSTNIMMGLAVAVLTLTGFSIAGLPVLGLLLAVGAFAAFLQDHNRLTLISTRRPIAALSLDLIFIIGLIGLFIWEVTDSTLTGFVMGWALSSLGCSIIGVATLRTVPSVSAGIRWIHREYRDTRFFSGDFLVSNALTTAATFIVAAIGGVAAAGAIRAAQVLLTPILLVTRGLLVALGPEARSLVLAQRTKRFVVLCVGYSAAAILACAIAVVLVAVLPDAVLYTLLKEQLAGAREVFPYAAIATAMIGVAGGAGLGLRVTGRISKSFVTKLIALPVGLLGVILGTIYGGAPGSQAGLALGEAVRGIGTWSIFARNIYGRPQGQSAQGENDG